MDNCSSYSNKNISAVLSLKTELLRKQRDILKLKNNRTKCKEYDAKESELKFKTESLSHCTKPNETETQEGISNNDDCNVLEESKRILKMKSQAYDDLASFSGNSGIRNHTLVAFERKPSTKNHNRDEHYSETEVDNQDNSCEYIDEFGRTRKCSIEELKSIQKQNCASTSKNYPPEQDTIFDVSSSIKQNDLIDNIKEIGIKLGWEQKTQENSHKEQLHYQDVFFDEARQHGVAYYCFSTNDSERTRQQKELESIRKKTLEEQKHRSMQKTQLESIKSMRVLAAKNRKRARIGLPPLTIEQVESKKHEIQEVNVKEANDCLTKDNDPKKRLYNRPWDEHKINSNWVMKPERMPFSQKEWNEHKRKERIQEFAPIQTDAKYESFPQKRNITTENSSGDGKALSATIDAKLFQLRNSRST